MTIDDRSFVHPAVVPGWWLDHRLGEIAGAAMYGARRAVALEPGQVPEYATVLLADGDDHARHALDLLGPDAVTLEAVRVDLGPTRTLALVLPATVVPEPAVALPLPTAPTQVTVPAPPQPIDGPERAQSQRRAGVRVAFAMGILGAVLVGGRALRATDRGTASGAPPVEIEAWDAATGTATVRHGDRLATYALGSPGDQLLLGDWDGDGVRTPALYRTDTGEVWVFDRWPGEGEAADAQALGIHAAGGTPRVTVDQDRDTVVVDPPAP